MEGEGRAKVENDVGVQRLVGDNSRPRAHATCSGPTYYVGPYELSVVVVPDHMLGGNEGVFDCHRQLIMVSDCLQGWARIETEIHELLHAMLSVAAVGDILDEDLEERLVLRLSPVLCQFLKENPSLLKWQRLPGS